MCICIILLNTEQLQLHEKIIIAFANYYYLDKLTVRVNISLFSHKFSGHFNFI